MDCIYNYKEYKDSGIEWVGMIPAHWKTIPNKRIMHKEKRICEKWTDENIMSLTMNGVIIRDLSAGGKMPASFDGYQYVYPGELLMCLFDIDVTPRCVGRVYDEGVTSPAYSAFVLNDNVDWGYYYYYYLMVDNKKELLHLAKNLRHSLTEGQLGALKVPLPSLEEQKAISKYLDERIKKADSIIAEINESLSEYKKWKASMIQEATLHGLRAHEKYKESNCAWIKQIPYNWDVCRLKQRFAFGKGLNITKDDLIDEGVPVISYGQIHGKYNPGTKLVDELIRYVPEEYIESTPGAMVHKGDILVADTSEDLEGCGNAVFVDKEMQLFGGYHTIILRALTKDDNRYISYLMKTDAWRSQIRSKVSGVKLFSISKKILGSTSFVLPPIDEQQEIVRFLDEKCKVIDEIIFDKEQLIKDLEAYKKSLIYEVVTGKRRVV